MDLLTLSALKPLNPDRSMNRRAFLKTSAAVSAVAGTAQWSGNLSAQGYNASDQHYLELRHYLLERSDQQEVVARFWKQAAIPALNRIGIRPVGVFFEMPDAGDPGVYVLTQYQNLDQFAAVKSKLMDDQLFMDAAYEYLETEQANPAYQRIESTLMRAFASFPEIKAPPGGDRIFQLRTYESHNEKKAHLKVEMFNEAEIPIFRDVGLNMVFFGESLVGPRLPNLTYMLTFRDQEEREAAWKRFGESPAWQELRTRERYRDTVSHITNKFLRPAPFSQI